MQLTVLLPGKSHGWRSLVGCSPWGLWESDMTERLHFHFSLSCTGEGDGNPLQCSYLENPGDGGAWWAAVYGVAQGRTRPKRLSSSSSMLRYASSMPTFWRVFIVNACWILSKAFSASIDMTIWFLFFSLLMWCITLIDLCTLNNPCIPEMNPTLSWCMIF